MFQSYPYTVMFQSYPYMVMFQSYHALVLPIYGHVSVLPHMVMFLSYPYMITNYDQISQFQISEEVEQISLPPFLPLSHAPHHLLLPSGQ